MIRKSVPPSIYDLRGIAVHDTHRSAENAGHFGRVAVWLEDSPVSASPVTATMQQHNLRFEPDMLIVPTGSKILFPNFDPIFHNIFSLSRIQPFDLGYYAEGKSREMRFLKEGIVQVYCHVHPEMYAVIVVTSSRWTARPSSDGTFSWTDVPPGKYRVLVWQRSTGLSHKVVVVPATGAVQVRFSLPDDEADR
jgi:plastocyanin